jgi:hypothetical protein
MGLIRNPDVVRIAPEDPIPNYLAAKVVGGEGIVITRKIVDRVGLQAVFSCDKPSPGSSGIVVEASGNFQVPANASLVIVNAASEPTVVTLPHPADCIGWLSLTCVDNSNPIQIKALNEDVALPTFEVNEDGINGSTPVNDGIPVNIATKIFDKSNIDFQAAGDSLIFASNRFDTWYCIGQYRANWYR